MVKYKTKMCYIDSEKGGGKNKAPSSFLGKYIDLKISIPCSSFLHSFAPSKNAALEFRPAWWGGEGFGVACFQRLHLSHSSRFNICEMRTRIYPIGLSWEPCEIKYMTTCIKCEVCLTVSSVKPLKYFASPNGLYIWHILILTWKWQGSFTFITYFNVARLQLLRL